MENMAQEQFEESFTETSDENQDSIIKAFESGDAKLKGVDSDAFFIMLRQMTFEGAFSDPLYGGNKNLTGWEMVEYPGAIASNTDIIESDIGYLSGTLKRRKNRWLKN